MKSITKDYLNETIHRMITENILVYRQAKKDRFYYEPFPVATDEEILDFIHSIPYFDIRLKDFLIGNCGEETIIISQTWEIEFIKKCRLWCESFEWLHASEYFISEAHLRKLNQEKVYLTLPY